MNEKHASVPREWTAVNFEVLRELCCRISTRVRKTQYGGQVMPEHLEAARLQPALVLLVDRRPKRQVVGHRPPKEAVRDHIPQAVEHRAQ